MIYAIISDVHANAAALESVLKDARTHGATAFISLGDTVGYGPEPTRALSLIRKSCGTVLKGNHDAAVAATTPLNRPEKDFNDLAAEAVRRHRAELSTADKTWLRDLPLTCRFAEAAATHGDFTAPDYFLYTDNTNAAAANFAAVPEALLFVGHSHSPAIYVQTAEGEVVELPPQDFLLEPNRRFLVNPGSVGYPREADGRCLSSYVLYDTELRTVRFRFLAFSVASLMPRNTPQRPAQRYLRAALFVLPLVAAGFAATLFLSRDEAKPTPLAAETVQLPALTTATCETTGMRFIRANLKLTKGSAGALTTVEFRDAAGKPLDTPAAYTVKRTFAKRLRVPEGAVQALIAVRRLSPDATPEILSLAPTAER